jgi:hypothetical protein
MKSNQKQTLESFVRIVAFADAHPVTGPLTYAGAREALEQAIRRLRERAGTQVSGRELSRGEARRQQQLVQRLIDRHIRPIIAIAKAQIEPESDVRLPAVMRMPRRKIGVTRLLQSCDGIIDAARSFETILIAHGLPADFLAQFTDARNALETSLGGRATLVSSHVAARAALDAEIRRGRTAVRRIDAVVRASFDGDPAVLAAWRAASRVQLLPGGTGRGGAAAEPQEVTSASAEGSPRPIAQAA